MQLKFAPIAVLFMMYFVSGCSDSVPEVCSGVNGVGAGINKAKAVNDGEFVKFAFQAGLQREADAAGLSYHCQLLKDGKASRAGIIEAFSSNAEHNKLREPQ